MCDSRQTDESFSEGGRLKRIRENLDQTTIYLFKIDGRRNWSWGDNAEHTVNRKELGKKKPIAWVGNVGEREPRLAPLDKKGSPNASKKEMAYRWDGTPTNAT